MRIARLAALALLVGCAHRQSAPIHDWDILVPVDSLPTDAAVLARLTREHPCVTRVPRLSQTSESFSARTNCALMETAVAAIRNLIGAPEVLQDLREFRIGRVQCITLAQEALRNKLTHRVESAHWMVGFSSDDQPDVAVSISRLTGEARAFAIPAESDFTDIDKCD
jgi:hypothetical protein